MTLGVRMHTGWACVVALSGTLDDFQIHCRRRIELLPPGSLIPRFVYHAASAMQPSDAAPFVESAVEAARTRSLEELKTLIAGLPARPVACGILTGSTQVPPELDRILASHPLIHAAEGKLFGDALSAAAEACRLPLVAEPEKRVWTTLAAALGRPPEEIRSTLDDARALHGAPWGIDQKLATAAALLARARATLHAR